MKKILCILWVLVIQTSLYAQDSKIIIDNQTPGRLSSLLTYSQQTAVEDLTITGYVNGSDMSFVSNLIKNYNLKVLDLSNVTTIINGKENFIWGGFLYCNGEMDKVLQKVRLPLNIVDATDVSNYIIQFRVDTIEVGWEKMISGISKYHPNHLILLDGVKIIPYRCFMTQGEYDMTYYNHWPEKCYNVTLSKTITTIGGRAFGRCAIFDEPFTFPDCAEYIGRHPLVYDSYHGNYGHASENSWCERKLQISDKRFSFPRNMRFYNSLDYESNTAGGTRKIFCADEFMSDTIVVYENCDTLYANLNAKIAYFYNTKPIVECGEFNIDTLYVPDGSLSEYINTYRPSPDDNIKVIKGMKAVKGVKITCDNQSCLVGDKIRLRAIITPEDAFNKSVKWNTSDVSIASVNNEGVVTAIRGGDVWIIATSEENTDIKDSCKISIHQPVTGITLSQDSCKLNNLGESVQLAATVLPADATNKNVTWKSFNDAVCVVVNGKVIATGYGTTVVLATTEDGGFSASCTVTVAQPTYTLNIKATGNGSATYNGTNVRGGSRDFVVNTGTSATIIFSPDDGYRISSVKLNNTDVTASVANSRYTINNITANTTLAVTFEAIPPTTYAFTISAVGNGTVSYDGKTVRSKTSSFTVVEGTNVVVKFSADEGYRLKSVKLDNTDVTSSVKNNQYIISNIKANTSLEVIFEAIPTYALNITASGNGSVTYNNIAVRGKTQTFTASEGTSATIKFTPDAGYKIKSVKLNTTDVTASVANNQYTISNIKSDNTLEVEFEAITHTLTIKAMGNGSATFNSTAVKGKSQAFTVNEGTSATVTFTPEAGYRIKSVKLNTTDVTASVANNQYTICNIKSDNTLEVEFEAIPPTTYTFAISAVGNGTVTYDGNTVRGKTSSFTVVEGTNAVVTFSADEGYRLKSMKLGNTDVTSAVVNNQYTIRNIKANTSLEVTFEAIPTYSLNITASGNGSATYNGTAVRGKTQTFTVKEGTSATVTFAPDEGYRIASVKLNGTDVTASVANNMYTISSITANTTLAVTFEAIPPTTYTFNITASGNGYVAYDGNSIRGKTSSFSLEEGSNAVLKFSADEGNRLKSVKVNGQDVTSTIINNQYTINNITANTSVEVVFEAIPSYSLNIVASGNGNAVYNGMIIRNQSKSFTLQEGSSATISFTPDANYRIKSVKVNNADVTSQVVNGQITISNIVQDTNVEVSFEEIPPTTYSLTITAIGNGAITYDGNSIRGGSSTFTVVEGSYVTVQITADDGYRLKRVTYNGNDVTASAVSGRFTTDKITANSTLVVEFEAIPTFSLTIKSSAFGCVKYGNAVITNQTEAFTVREGASAVLSFVPDGNGRLQHVTLNGADITSELKNGQYTISNIWADQSVEAEYVEDITKVTDAGVAYMVTSYDEGTVVVAAGNYGQVLTVPASFTAKGKTWTVIGIDDDALTNATELAAIIWEPEVPFTAQVSNPNLLLYVKKDEYAQSNVQNVVVGDQAENIVLTEAESGNNFYCPKAFEAKRISYEHNYSMISGYKICQGWETLVLPFDVTMAINAKGTELVPYTNWAYGTNLRPFWLYQLTNEGWKTADGIKANVPYIISMPNNEMYESSYNLTGNIQFIGTNVEVKASDNPTTSQYGNKRLVANYQNQTASSDIYALNVSNEWHQNTATEKEGSTFIRALRAVHPFEAYLTVESSAAGQRAIPIFDNVVPTAIVDVMRLMSDGRSDNEWYDLQGRKLQGKPTMNGIYINKGKKIRK